MKTFAGYKFTVAIIIFVIFDRIDNIVGKCWLATFSLFPTMLSISGSLTF